MHFLLRLVILAAVVAAFGSADAAVIKTVQAGATDVTVALKIIDATDGTPETGVVFDTSGIDLEYWRHGANAAADITEVTQTANGAHTDGGFVHIGHGVYRLDLPDAAVASGADAVEVYGTVPGMIVIGGTVEISTDTPQSGDAYARIGAAGANLSNIPWNSAWDAEVQSEAADALLNTTVEGVTLADYFCRYAAVLYGQANYDTIDDETAFSDPDGGSVRVTVAYGTDAGDRSAVTFGTSCGP